MNMDLYNNYLGQFISNYAMMLSLEKSAAADGRDLTANPKWAGAQDQRKRLQEARDLLIANPVSGAEGGDFVSSDRWNPTAGIKISPDRVRAMAADAGTLMQIAMGGSGRDAWWYDPDASEGITSHFPGQPDNANAT